MKQLISSLILAISLTLLSCRAQDTVLDYYDFKQMIDNKEIDKVIFYKDSDMVTVIKDGTETHYEHSLDILEGKRITRALSKAKIIYKTKDSMK